MTFRQLSIMTGAIFFRCVINSVARVFVCQFTLGRYDIEHKDIQCNGTLHKGPISDTKHKDIHHK
jgi:hypothetical protein